MYLDCHYDEYILKETPLLDLRLTFLFLCVCKFSNTGICLLRDYFLISIPNPSKKMGKGGIFSEATD